MKESNTTPGGRIIQRDRRQAAYEMGDGTLTISTVKRRRLTETTHQDDADNIEDFIAKLTYFPRSGTGGMFKATLTQQAFRNGTYSSIPRLQVNLVLPRDSLVFELVRDGRVMELEALLREGKASLRDHDDLGNSLLAVGSNPVVQPWWFSFVDVQEGLTKTTSRLPHRIPSQPCVDFFYRSMPTLMCMAGTRICVTPMNPSTSSSFPFSDL